MLICCLGEDSDHVERERCSRVHLDAITSDDAGNFYAFRSEIEQQTTICFYNWFPSEQRLMLLSLTDYDFGGANFLSLCHISKQFHCFAGHHFIRKDEGNDTLTVDTIESDFKELHSEVDAVFSYQGHLHMIKVKYRSKCARILMLFLEAKTALFFFLLRTTIYLFTKLVSHTPSWKVTPSL